MPMTAAGLSSSPAFERSERALSLVNQTVARFNRESSTLGGLGMLFGSRLLTPRARRSPWLPEWRQDRVEDAISRLLAIADEFSLGLLVEVTEQRIPNDELVRALWKSHVERDTDTWDQRFGSWKQLHGVAISSGFPDQERLQGFV